MGYPNVDKAINPTAQAVSKQTQLQIQVVPYDFIDWNVSGVIGPPPAPPVWTNYEKMFMGIMPSLRYDPATQLAFAPPQSLYLQFIKPITIGNVVVGGLGGIIGQAAIVYLDGVLENLVYLGPTNMGDAYAPPIRNVPVSNITFLNFGPGPVDIYSVSIVMPQVSAAGGGGGGGMIASPNNFFGSDVLIPIPPGFLGVALAFGFNSEGFIVKNSSGVTIEFSEDAGVTWEQLDAHDAVCFDFKMRTQIIVRDPLGVGGQAYRLWGW